MKDKTTSGEIILGLVSLVLLTLLASWPYIEKKILSNKYDAPCIALFHQDYPEYNNGYVVYPDTVDGDRNDICALDIEEISPGIVHEHTQEPTTYSQPKTIIFYPLNTH